MINMVQKLVTIPDNLMQYVNEKGLSLSKFLQNKIREEIKKDGLEHQYQITEK